MTGPRAINWAAPVADHPLNRGLVGWWLPLPNASGGQTLADLFGRYPFALTGGPSWGAGPGQFPGVTFDGSSQYGTAAALTALPTVLTLAARVKRVGSGGGFGNYAVAKDSDTAGRSFALGITAANLSYVEVNGSSQVTGGAALTAGQWYWLVWSWDGSFTRFYQDQTYVGFNTAALTTSTTPLTVGRRAYSGFEGYFPGAVAEVRLWNRVLGDGSPSVGAAAGGEVVAFQDDARRGYPDTLRRGGPLPWPFTPSAAPPPPTTFLPAYSPGFGW